MYSRLRRSGAVLAALAAVLYGSMCAAVPNSPTVLDELAGLGASIVERADPSLVGYLGAFFLGEDPYVYFYLSDGNNPIAFTALNKGAPIIKPTTGTGGVRDPAIVRGGGAEAGKKWFIVGTDLNIDKTTWDLAQRNGSRGIYVWESTDLVNWTDERLVTVEDASAGMVWAPEAIWDPARGQYMAYWASKFYPASDPQHAGDPSNIKIRYAYTADFRSFTPPQTYIDYAPTDIIDLTLLPLDGAANNGTSFLRFMKDETRKTVFVEVSRAGLFGRWGRLGGCSAVIENAVEGPAAYLDNVVPGKVHLLLDFYGGDGYHPYESSDPANNKAWTASDRSAFPSNLRHGSVLPVNQTLYDALSARWG